VLLRLLPLVAALALAGCGGGDSEQGATATAESSLPPGCSVTEVEAIVNRFLERPDLAPPGFFQVYGTNESDGQKFVARARARALAHIGARKRLGERQRMLSLRVAPQDVNHVRITFTLTRTAPDFGRRGIRTRIASGAGTLDCAHGKIAAWVVKGP
jgi:hypothetical protein